MDDAQLRGQHGFSGLVAARQPAKQGVATSGNISHPHPVAAYYDERTRILIYLTIRSPDPDPPRPDLRAADGIKSHGRAQQLAGPPASDLQADSSSAVCRQRAKVVWKPQAFSLHARAVTTSKDDDFHCKFHFATAMLSRQRSSPSCHFGS